MFCSSCSCLLLTLAIAVLILLFSLALLSYSWQNEQLHERTQSKNLPLLMQLKTPKSADDKTVELCFYNHFWLAYNRKGNRHPCFAIAESDNDRPLSVQERKLRAMFQQLLRRDREDRKLVGDCFRRHRFDDHPPCWGISWGGRDLLGNHHQEGAPLLRERRIRQIWLDLVGENFRREMRCRFHPWIAYNDC